MASSAQFRIQHVAQKPRGWRVRTKREARHELRIGFPPGQRRKGSGKLLEILHPKGERNPECELAGKNPAELIIFGNPAHRGGSVLARKSNHKPGCGCAICKNARGEKHSPGCQCALCRKSRGENPRGAPRFGKGGRRLSPWGSQQAAIARKILKMPDEMAALWGMTKDEARRILNSLGVKENHTKRRRNQSEETGQAVKLFQTFHGRDPVAIIKKHVADTERMDFTALGALEYLLVENEDGASVKINFEGDSVTLASSPQANQLYFIGGNQNLALCLDKFTDDPSKDLIDLGDAIEVEYLARKAQGNFEPVNYFHRFGEKKRGSDLPRAIYDKLRKQVFLAGGEYTIEQPGIIN